jgi:hypothetical protein
MARYFGVGRDREVMCYCFERCEEIVLIDAYLKARSRIRAPLRSEFEYRFFEAGNGIAFDLIDQLSGEMRRIGFPELKFAETTIFEYGRNPDRSWKAQERQQLMDDLEAMDEAARERLVALSRREMEQLPPPHRTWVKFSEAQAQGRGAPGGA